MNKDKQYKAPYLRYVMSCILSVLLVAFVVVVPGCAQEEAPPEPKIPAHFTTYTDEAGLFSISYPNDWELALSLIEDLEEATAELIKSIDSDAPVERFSSIFFAGVPVNDIGYDPNVNIGVESLPGVIWTHDKAVEAEIDGIKSIIQDYREVSHTKTTVGGRQATILEWEGTFPQIGRQHLLQLMVLVGKTVWIVSCGTSPENFGDYKDDFYAIVRSLRILK